MVKKQFMFASASYAIRNIVPYFWGICAFVLIMKAPQLQEAFFPKAEGAQALDSLYALPVFLGRILPAGLVGIITAAMIAAFMSTHDSYFLCWSSVITNDIIVPLKGETVPEEPRVADTDHHLPDRRDHLHRQFRFSHTPGSVGFHGRHQAPSTSPAHSRCWSAACIGGGRVLPEPCWRYSPGCSAVLGLGVVKEKVFVAFLGLDPAFVEKHITVARIGIGTILLTIAAMVIGSLLFSR